MASPFTIIFPILLLHLFQGKGVRGATITFVNTCQQTIWPATLGTPTLDTTGFELPNGGSRALQAPTGWSGRFWGRTGCTFYESGHGSCKTGDCGSGEVECNGAGATASTLAEFTLGSGSMDFYDVSLVDGFNVPMMVDVRGGSGQCASTGCVEDINQRCPAELKAEGGGSCRSACNVFNTAEYCCTGAFASPATCKPSMYSQVFKTACPKAYSYAYDDATSTFTCTAADYVITFCPSQNSSSPDNDGKKPIGSGPGLRSGSEAAPGSGSGLRSENETVPGSESGSENKTVPGSRSGPGTEYWSGSGSENEIVPESGWGSGNKTVPWSGSREGSGLLGEGTWLANLANGESTSNEASGAAKLMVMLIGLVHFSAAQIPLQL